MNRTEHIERAIEWYGGELTHETFTEEDYQHYIKNPYGLSLKKHKAFNEKCEKESFKIKEEELKHLLEGQKMFEKEGLKMSYETLEEIKELQLFFQLKK